MDGAYDENQRMPQESVEDLVDRSGVVVARYVRTTRARMPCAARLEELGPRADIVAALIGTRPGWAVVTGEELGTALLDAGARLFRNAHQMLRDLRADPPDPAWSALRPPDGMRLDDIPTGRHAPLEEIHRLTLRAYPPGHPDHEPDMTEVDAFTSGLLCDHTSPLCPASAVVRDGDRLAGVLLVTDGAPGPWIGNVMRDPDPRYAGLGALMLRHGMVAATAHGDRTIGLAVSHTNPARQLYERLGFRTTARYVTVILP